MISDGNNKLWYRFFLLCRSVFLVFGQSLARFEGSEVSKTVRAVLFHHFVFWVEIRFDRAEQWALVSDIKREDL